MNGIMTWQILYLMWSCPNGDQWAWIILWRTRRFVMLDACWWFVEPVQPSYVEIFQCQIRIWLTLKPKFEMFFFWGVQGFFIVFSRIFPFFLFYFLFSFSGSPNPPFLRAGWGSKPWVDSGAGVCGCWAVVRRSFNKWRDVGIARGRMKPLIYRIIFFRNL